MVERSRRNDYKGERSRMKEAFEKIVERLEEPQFNIGCGACPIKEKCDEVQETIDDEMTDLCAETMRVIAKEIVQDVAKEYNNELLNTTNKQNINNNINAKILFIISNTIQQF